MQGKDLDQFRAAVGEYRRAVGRRQAELAHAIGLHPNVLSHRLHGKSATPLTSRDVIAIVTALASWGAITTLAEAEALLGMMNVPPGAIPDSAWSAPPFSTLRQPDRASSRFTETHQASGTAASGRRRSRLRPAIPPVPGTPLIGRGAERDAISAALGVSRLVTLTGVGGTGKTRLALQVASDLRDCYADGVALLDLAPVRDPALISAALVRALGLDPPFRLSAEESLAAALQDAHLLLVADNVEHVVEGASLFARLLAAAPGLRILATSRIPLHLYGEQEIHVPPLSLPLGGAPPNQVTRSEAVQLFIQRARAVRRDFDPQGETLCAVAAICTALDGLPLAIELAAGRSKLFTPEAMLPRLRQRLSLLTGGPRDRPSRQQTFRAALDWSYALLDPEAQRLLAHLSVFAGSIDPRAAAAVSGDRADDTVTLERLAVLQDASLLEVVPEQSITPLPQEGPRFRLLQTVREYAMARLAESGEADRAVAAHAHYFLSLGEEAGAHLQRPQQAAWWALLDTEIDNLRAALQWYRTVGDAENELRLSVSLAPFWHLAGYRREARGWLEEGLARGANLPPRLRVQATEALGSILTTLDESERAEALLREALDCSRALGDVRTTIRALSSLGGLAIRRADYDLALTLQEEAYELSRELGDRRWSGTLLKILADASRFAGNRTVARRQLDEALSIHRETGNEEGMAITLLNLGSVALEDDDLPEAERCLTESLSLCRALTLKQWQACALWTLGALATRKGEYEEGRAHLHESLTMARDMGDSFLMLGLIDDVAVLIGSRGDVEAALLLAEAHRALRQSLDMPAPPMFRDRDAIVYERAETVLTEEDYNRVRAEGESLSLDEAVGCALAYTRPPS